MKKIIYRFVEENEIDKDFLKDFIRYQETEKIYYVKDGQLFTRDEIFLENWDEKHLERISLSLKEISQNGIVIAAYNNDRVIGFATLDNEIFNEVYLNMQYIHISNDFRRQGIGRRLFNKILVLAKQKGAKKLYISANPAAQTQEFYKKVGCKLAEVINQKLYDEEPCDIHLERDLSDIEVDLPIK